ncbi:hypothetical protein [Pseudonocardia adelaidensis]|uniref:Uncharacterized protein n=1 Tax=Pseudonocardia adelaidensis TaxID=648754 RepID=A0ABP9NV00_9PSEU
MAGAKLLFPVGHDLGAFHPGDGESGPVQQVRLGSELVELSDSEFLVWTLAHGLVDDDGQSVPITEAAILDYADEPGSVHSLAERGLLVEVVPGSPESVQFASIHQLLPLAMGLGNSRDQPWLFAVGLLYRPLVVMTGAMYDLWQWAHLSPNLWLACRELAAVATGAGIADPEQTEPELVLAGALGSLHQLLALRVACLDTRIEGL